ALYGIMGILPWAIHALRSLGVSRWLLSSVRGKLSSRFCFRFALSPIDQPHVMCGGYRENMSAILGRFHRPQGGRGKGYEVTEGQRRFQRMNWLCFWGGARRQPRLTGPEGADGTNTSTTEVNGFARRSEEWQKGAEEIGSRAIVFNEN